MSGIRRSKRKSTHEVHGSKRKRISYAESSTTDTEDEEDEDIVKHTSTGTSKRNEQVTSDSKSDETGSDGSENSNDESKANNSTSSSNDGKESSSQRQLRTRNVERKASRKPKKSEKKIQKKGRKKIHRIIEDEDLEDETKEAEKEERERLERLKQKEAIKEDVAGEKDDSTISAIQIVLQKQPCVAVCKYLSEKLRPHQVEGIRFIWTNIIESTNRAKDSVGGGCILAHCMGLGKTLQTIAIAHTILKSRHLNFKTVLVVAPMNTVRNWMEEFVYWCEDGDELLLYNFTELKTNKERVKILKTWAADGGVLILGYDMYRIMTTKIKYSGYKKVVAQTLIEPGPDIVVCDEGHMLKNAESHISKQLNKVKTRRRLVLTGTPLQNNLVEYHCMVNFVKPGLLGSLKEFRNRFVNPITNGQHIDSTDRDVKIMKKRSHVLHEMLEGFVQRKDYTCLKPFLDSKYEYVIKVRLTPLQVKLYQHYLDSKTNRGDNESVKNTYGKGASLFCDYQNLMRVWTHPKCLLMHSEQREKMLLLKEENNFITDDESDSSSEGWDGSDKDVKKDVHEPVKQKTVNKSSVKRNLTEKGTRKDDLLTTDTSDTDPEELTKRKINKTKQKPVVIDSSSGSGSGTSDNQENSEEETSEEESEKIPHVKSRETRTNRNRRYRLRCARESGDSSDVDLKENFYQPPKQEEWYEKILKEDPQSSEDHQSSMKIVLLFEILRLAEERKEKTLVFSQSLTSLDLIEEMLPYAPAPETEDKDADNNTEGALRWYRNVDYFRMDGHTQGQYRQRWINAFNDEDDTRSRLFLISTKAGGLGVNLVGANRVVIFDASWNPSHDTQSMFRIYRFGQTRKCYIYRFIAEGTMEEKIYQRQVNKQSLAFRVVDEQQINRHFTASSLSELYKFEPTMLDPNKPSPLPIVPKDEVLAEILSGPSTRHMIVSYHEHDSLLDHQTDQELTEEERKSAWEEYEASKLGRVLNANSHGTPNPSAFPRYPGTSGAFAMPSMPMNGTLQELMAFKLNALNKMMMKAYSQYHKSGVNTVPTIMKRLRQTPMYKTYNEANLRALATEVNMRLRQQRQEKADQFQRVRLEYLKVQSEFYNAFGNSVTTPINTSLIASQFRELANQRMSNQVPSPPIDLTDSNEGFNQAQTSTSIEVIDITEVENP